MTPCSQARPQMAKSMGLNMAAGTSGMLKQGHKSFEGLDEAVYKNIEAAKVIPCSQSRSTDLVSPALTHLNPRGSRLSWVPRSAPTA